MFGRVGSGVAAPADTVLLMTVPDGVEAGTSPWIVITWTPGGSGVRVQLTVPLEPTAGVAQLQRGAVTDWNSTLLGSGSLTVTLAASLGPFWVIVSV